MGSSAPSKVSQVTSPIKRLLFRVKTIAIYNMFQGCVFVLASIVAMNGRPYAFVTHFAAAVYLVAGITLWVGIKKNNPRLLAAWILIIDAGLLALMFLFGYTAAELKSWVPSNDEGYTDEERERMLVDLQTYVVMCAISLFQLLVTVASIVTVVQYQYQKSESDNMAAIDDPRGEFVVVTNDQNKA